MWHVESFFFHGTHNLDFKVGTAQMDLEKNGLNTFLFCEDLQDELLSVITSVKAFVGGLGLHGKVPLFDPQVPEYMEKANKEFLKWAVNFDLVERKTTNFIGIDENLIKSGDYFAVLRLDGLDPIIMYGTGSHSGHTVMAQRFDGELYIIESQDAWYWPIQRIQRNKFSEWIKMAADCDFNVVYMPLSDEARARYNETAAAEFFLERQGLPYGYHNFLYGWIDTPFDNFPSLLPAQLVPVVFSMLEYIDKSMTDTFFTQSLNFKLGTQDLSIPQVAAEAAKRN